MTTAFLFDIDGTLVDSSLLISDVWRQVAEEFGADVQEILAVCHGRRDSEIVPMFFRESDVPAVLARIQELEGAGTDLVRAMPDALALLERLPADRWAVVTSGPREVMAGRLRSSGLPVPSVFVAAEDVTKGKPDPEGYLAAASALGADPGRCVVVEDAPAGVAAGRRAGMHVIAVTTTHRADELQEADVIVAGLAEIDLVGK